MLQHKNNRNRKRQKEKENFCFYIYNKLKEHHAYNIRLWSWNE